ncbi:major capsid protein [Xylophilus ampelinus]|uniref:Major capsid protein E n=1 Tax=Xylophilus ampelinus TaxID=54067 RepID=A0A318SQM9_9BURK|nr:major capsid protein [Xylophilus ampelinus]MCS4509140.1 major capsid protein [Xylophilus ampelinus]PYE79832.1 major capsid protein E [Xylophilus ampelinus]
MAQQTTSQARVQDPILTAVARGYSSPKASVANVLFPAVPVGTRAGRILSFGPDDFKLIVTARAPGSNTKRVQFGFASDRFSLVDHRLEGGVPTELQEEAAAVPGIDLGANAVRRVQNQMALERENMAATIALDANRYAASNKEVLSGTSQWSNVASDPFTDILDAKEVIRGQTGEEANVLALGPKTLTALRTHPKVLDRLSTASDRPPATLAQLSALFEIQTIVKGEAVYHTGTAFADVWGKDAVLAFTTPASMQEMGSPSYGYTYQLNEGPEVEESYFDNNTSTWYYPVSDAYQPVLVGPSAGFLFKGAVA